MTTMNIQDILHKKSVTTKYQPNSYRIFCEDIGNQSVADDSKYSSQAPAIYTQPLIVPAQAIEERNRPHAGRSANFLRDNAHMLNEPVNRISSKNVNKTEEKRWWEWDVKQEEIDSYPNWKNRAKRSQSSSVARDPNSNGASEFQTTYQKDHGYVKSIVQSGGIRVLNENQGGANRHSYNPNNSQAIGIVPVNDLNSFTKSNEPQRVFVDKMSFEHEYDSRKDGNYPNRGKRHGAFVIEQIEPKPALGTKVYQDSNKGQSVWDAMHPDDSLIGQIAPKTQVYQKPPTVNPDVARNQRRDPIGYFEDTKFGGSLGSNMPNTNPGPNFNPNIMANTREAPNGLQYQPSWSNSNTPANNMPADHYNDHQTSNDLLENAMKYQRPMVMANGGYQN